jgi:hypothetical protein
VGLLVGAWFYDRASLRRDVHALQSRLAAEAPTPAAEDSMASPHAASVDPSRQVVRLTAPFATPSALPAAAPRPAEPSPPSVEDQHAFLQASFDGQTTDASWARSSRAQLEDDIRRRLPASSSLHSVDCRSSICKADIVHADETGYRTFVNSTFATDPGERSAWRGPLAMWRSGSGEDWTMTVFFGKDGEPLPALP